MRNSTTTFADDDGEDPFAGPSQREGFKIQEHEGRLLLVTPSEITDPMETPFGARTATRASVAVLDGPEGGTEHHDVLIFPDVLQDQLRDHIGHKPLLGRLGRGGRAWKFLDYDRDDRKVGLAFMQSKAGGPPFQAPKAKGDGWGSPWPNEPPSEGRPPF